MVPTRLTVSLSNEILLLRDDAVYHFEPDGKRDRVRRVPHERIVRLWSSVRFPWARLALCLLFCLAPGLAMVVSAAETAWMVLGGMWAGAGLIGSLWICGRRVVFWTFDMPQERRRVRLFLAPGRARRLEESLRDHIHRRQEDAWARLYPDQADPTPGRAGA